MTFGDLTMDKEKDKEKDNTTREDQHVNQETLDAIEEGLRMMNDPSVRGYHDIESLFKALESE